MIMSKFRKRMKLIFWIVVFGFVAWLVFEVGANILGIRIIKPWQRGILAEYKNGKITYNAFLTYYENVLRDTLESRGVEELPFKDKIKILDGAWQNLIDDIVLNYLKKQNLIKFSDQFILEILKNNPPPEILNDPRFRDSLGKFNLQLYWRILFDPRNVGYFSVYENRIRKQLSSTLLEWEISSILYPDDSYLKKRFEDERTAVRLRKLDFPWIKYRDTNFTWEEVKEYYKKHIKDYELPPWISLAFAIFKISPSSEDTQSAKDRIYNAYEELKNGVDFSEVVKLYSDELGRDSSGLIGWVKKFGRYYYLYTYAESLEVGKYSEPILTKEGFEIIKLLDRSDDSLKLARIIVRINVSPTTKMEISDKAKDLLDDLKDGGNIEDSLLIKKYEYTLRKIRRFFYTRSRYVPYIGSNKEVLNFVKKAKVGEADGIYRVGDRYIVLQVVDKGKGPVPFEKIKDKVKRDYMVYKSTEKAFKEAKILYEKIKSGEINFDTIKGAELTGWFYKGAIPVFPLDIYYDLFNLKIGEIKLYKEKRGAYIVKVVEKKQPNPKEFGIYKARAFIGIWRELFEKLKKSFKKEVLDKLKFRDYRKYFPEIA